jgi:glycosyltransferase involved in cell wall biosynthesis
MRILHCIPHLSGGGAERQLRYLAEEQAARGQDVHVAYLSEGARPELPRWAGVGLHRLACRGNYDPRILVGLRRVLCALSAEIVQSWVIQMDVVVGLLPRTGRWQWVLREPASDEHYLGWKGRLRSALGRRASAVVANSTTGAAYWQRHSPRVPVRVVHNGIPVREIEACAPRPWVAADGTQRDFLLFAGRLEPQKNLVTLLRALAIANRRTPVHAVWCGAGSLRTDLEALAQRLGLADRVTFLGQQPAEVVWGLMKSAVGFTFVSWYEGLPNVIMEAVACGCPLVLSDISAHRELLSEAQFVDPASAEDIAAAIARVVSHPQRNRRAAQQAAARAMQWSIARMADAYEDVYASIGVGNGL